MKKTLLSLMLVIGILAVMTLAVSAANIDAFSTITLNGSTEKYINSETDNQGGGGNPISYVEGYGCGYSSVGDIVWFQDVDFGSTGAKSMSILFSFGNDNGEKTEIAVYMDDYTDDAFLVGSLKVGFTGGWSIKEAKEFTFPCAVDAGVHNIYIKFTNTQSGSFSELKFSTDEAENREEETEVPYEGPKITDQTDINVFNADMNYIFLDPHETAVSYTENGVKLAATDDTNDPYVTFNLKRYYKNMGMEQISANDYPFMVIKMKADPGITNTVFELFGNCGETTNAGPDSAIIGSQYEGTGDWEYVVCDFSMSSEWDGLINNIRLDWCTGCLEDCFVEISQIRFFADEDSAYAFANGEEILTKSGDETTAVEKNDTESTDVTENVTTVADETTAEVTTAGENVTEAVTDESKGKSGCGGVVAFGIPALIVCAVFILRKKEN